MELNMHKNSQEMKELTSVQLQQKVYLLRQQLFALRLNASTDHVKDYSQFKKVRRAIACALTYLTQRNLTESDTNL